MKILDLGSHDGFLSLWLARQLIARGRAVEVVGIELNSDAVRAANERFARAGIPGHFEVGSAEDFTGEGFDFVLAYELIEHVEDPVRLLETAERACGPGGVVLLSTPDGTFGAGNNPHHLRTYRSIDLFDLARTRGELVDAEIGKDGIATVAYRPRSTAGLTIGIFTGAGWASWHPRDIYTKGLGGSETAAVRLADALANQGHLVTVYGELEEQGIVGQVAYRDHHTFDPTTERDVLIASRLPEVFDGWVNAGHRFLWLHDVDCADRLTEARAQGVTVLALSEWHRRHLVEVYPFLDDAQIIGNGIDLARFGSEPAPARRPHRALYTSSPDRGLDFLLRLWPKVREKVPDATLAYAYAPIYDHMAKQLPPLAKFRDTLRGLADQPGVQNLGHLSQVDLATEMRSSGLWLHPSWASPHKQRFYETFCIGALEAQAAGCAVIASNWGALPETVEFGSLLGAIDSDDPPDPIAWLEAIVSELNDEVLQAAAQKIGPERAGEGRSWDAVAERIIGGIVDPWPTQAQLTS